MRRQNTIARLLAIVFTLGAASGCATLADRLINPTTLDPPYSASESAVALHLTLAVVDLHADPLLWNRDLLQRNRLGHLDVPRMQDGNVALQVFGAVTATPFPPAQEDNSDDWDLITLLAQFEQWPRETLNSRLNRALFMASRLRDRALVSGGALRLIRTRADLDALVGERQDGNPVIGAMLSLEGAHALQGKLRNIDVLYDAGFRILGLTHFTDNAMAGSTSGERGYGLTDKGRQLIERAQALGMIIDLAHASTRTVDDVLAMVDRPVISSHGGVRGTCEGTRNLSDEHIRGIARTGGVIGIGLFEIAVCGDTIEHTVRAMRYVVDLVGIEYVALGSDFDGAVRAPMDVSGLALLTEALLKAGFSNSDIAAIMGGNALRVFRKTLPPGRAGVDE